MSIAAPDDKVIGLGGSFSLEKQMEQEILDKILASMKAIISSFKGRDQRLLGMLSEFPPPPILTSAKVYLLWRMRSAKSKELKLVIANIIKNIINPLLDMFDKRLVILENIFDPSIGRKAKKVIPTSDITALQAGRLDKGLDPEEIMDETATEKDYDERLAESVEGMDVVDGEYLP